ncbi:MAG: NADH-quinone oxidoreductase subunit C [Candidatus Thorarchaeota archaeon]|nr:NADH-quinone oxidoreductase subunit C [Candidatus Thorarchaeota archaeon]
MSDFSASDFSRAVLHTFPGVTTESVSERLVKFSVPASMIRDVVQYIADNVPQPLPESVFGVDLEDDNYELIYIFWSHPARFLCQIRVQLQGATPSISTVSDIFPGLEWHERETHEMFGINFEGHPDLRLLLLPEELEGKYPLRKRFKTDRSRLAESGLPVVKPRPRPKKEAESK